MPWPPRAKVVYSERYHEGVGEVTARDIVRREIIHALLVEPLPFSEFEKRLGRQMVRATDFEDILREVAEFKQPAMAQPGRYHLLPALHREFHPQFYHYSAEEKAKAEAAAAERHKGPIGARWQLPVPPPPATPPFARLATLPACAAALGVLHTVLVRACGGLAQGAAGTGVSEDEWLDEGQGRCVELQIVLRVCRVDGSSSSGI